MLGAPVSRRPSPVQTNRFTSPPAAVADVNDAAVDVAKPKAVWLMQGVAVLLIIELVLAMLGSVAIAFWHESRPGWPFVLLSCAIGGLLLFLVVLVLSGCQRRHPLGRWLGLVLIALLLLVGIASAVADLLFNDDRAFGTGRAAEMLLHWAFVAAMGYWFRVFGYSPRVRAWFGLPACRREAVR